MVALGLEPKDAKSVLDTADDNKTGSLDLIEFKQFLEEGTLNKTCTVVQVHSE
jgi:hypothetical protein